MRKKNPEYEKPDKMFQMLSSGKPCSYVGCKRDLDKKGKEKGEKCLLMADAVHHVVGRENIATRWLPDNGQVICTPCHNAIHAGNLREKPVLDYIRVIGRANFKDILQLEGMTKKDFIKDKEIKLKSLLNERC